MTKHNVLLICGTGASSGFMAANIRKAAAARGMEISVNARSESTVEDYVDEIDCLLIGPHLAHHLEDMEERCEGYDVKVAVIEKDAYARLNGEKTLDQILALFGEE
ncbi:MAG: PTS sugar transporter subunit IIB [Erysipelotrichaceae bacterium]|nr:PTS sugar transporter subunit IIB [Erysipelotrichaceae bacterium]